MTSPRAPVLATSLAALAVAAVVTVPTVAADRPAQADNLSALSADQRGGGGRGRQARPADQPRPQQGQLKVGDMATDFTLEPRGGGDPVTLSSFRGKSPVALVFGSYT